MLGILAGYGKAWVRMIGQFVTSKAGHDKGCLYVVVAQKDDFVYLCDGRIKKPEAPKKKRRKHIQLIHARVDKGLLDRLESGEKVYAEEIRYALKQYYRKQEQLPIIECGAEDAPFIRSERHASDKLYCQTCRSNQE